MLRGWRTLGNGEYLLELERPADVIRIRNLPAVKHITEALKSGVSGQKLMAFNVVRTEEENPLFSPTPFTALHFYGEDIE